MDRFGVLKSISFVVVVSFGIWNQCYGIGNFVINRTVNPQSNDGFRFLNRDFSCKELTQRSCRTYNGVLGGHFSNLTRCECSCSTRGLATFGFYDRKWSCLNDTKIRKQTGCTFRFQGEDPASSYHIKVLAEQSYHKIIIPSISCSIEYSRSRYVKCDGKWTGLNTLVSEPGPFKTLPFVETIPGTNIKVYTMKISKTTLLSGRLISLHFRCRPPAKSSCILFKLAGTFKCPILLDHPTLQPTSLPTKPTTQTRTSTKAISTVAIATRKQQPSSEGFSWIIVGVATALGIACLIGATVAIVMTILKRKKSKRKSNTCSRDNLNNSPSCYIKPTSPQTPNGGLIYDYAIVESSRKNRLPIHRKPNSGYEIPRESNSKKPHTNVPKYTEPVYEVAQSLRENSENSNMRDNEYYVTLYNDDGSAGC